ncbi:MAG: MFS transporter [Gordonibacter sp.]|uniref:MFS transporter n=1 Tax=Gordonibacter sp. TaxID=1968902 RepID=UPI002FC88029
MNNKDTAFPMSRRWLIFASVFFVGFVATFNMFKAPPLFPAIIPDLGFTDATIGWVMSMFSIIGVILAFPAGAILQKIGIKTSLIITAASLAIGSTIGGMATDVPLMLFSRFIEGIGMGLISVIGPTATASVIPRVKQGLAMGIWSIWFPAGAVAAFNISPALLNAFGWQSAWWAASILAVVAFVFVFAVYAQPPQDAAPTQDASGIAKSVSLKPDVRSIIFVSLAFMMWSIFNAGAIAGFYPTFLQQVHELDPQLAGFIASITNILVLFFGPLSGFLSDKFGARKSLMVFAFAGASILLTFAFSSSLTLVWIFVIALAIFSAACPTGVFALIPRLAKDPTKIGMGMASVTFFQNIGIIIGSVAFGPLVASFGWETASLVFCVPVALLGLVLSLLIRGNKKQGINHQN